MEFIYEYGHSAAPDEQTRWLLANGLGGYASTSGAFSVTMRDQGLLIGAVSPSHRIPLVHRLSEVLTTDSETRFLSTQTFRDGTPPEDGWRVLTRFAWTDGPLWRYRVGGVTVTRQCAVDHGKNAAAVVYTVENGGSGDCLLRVTPVFPIRSGEAAPVFRDGALLGGALPLYLRCSGSLTPLPPETEVLSYPDDEKNGRAPSGLGLRCCAAVWKIPRGQTARLELAFSTEETGKTGAEILEGSLARQRALLARTGFRDPVARELARSADAFLADRPGAGGKTIIAGYPFFGDWGRDTMIALPGCVLATGQYDTAKRILRTFLAYERDGLVPNLFPEGGAAPRYNTVDAALLLINCVWLYYRRTGDAAFVREAWPVMARIATAYQTGTHHAIGMDADGLIRAGAGLDQVTWMDVCVDGILPTPRHGKPVEINAYWYSALCVLRALAPAAGADGAAYAALAERVKASFIKAFWMEDRGYLKDVVSGTGADEQIRCNQIWAVSMPFTMLSPRQERQVVDTVYRHLYTPCGLRTLSPEDPEFHPLYGGPQRERDLAYHQGTVWPFPLGAWYLSYLKVNGNSPEAAAQVRQWLAPMADLLREGCVGQLPEIYDGLAPGPSKGCFAQAWSVGEILRVYEALETID